MSCHSSNSSPSAIRISSFQPSQDTAHADLDHQCTERSAHAARMSSFCHTTWDLLPKPRRYTTVFRQESRQLFFCDIRSFGVDYITFMVASATVIRQFFRFSFGSFSEFRSAVFLNLVRKGYLLENDERAFRLPGVEPAVLVRNLHSPGQGRALHKRQVGVRAGAEVQA